MKNITFLILTFGTLVQVKSGFFAGCSGPITDYQETRGLETQYWVDLRCRDGVGKLQYPSSPAFPESAIKVITRKQYEGR